MEPALLDELSDWLRIPSISADPAHAADVRRAGEWLCALVRGAGGDAEVVDWNGRPLAIGELRASRLPESAPTVLVYGHFDVQPPGEPASWESDPFEPVARDGWLHARGVSDDKGPLYGLLKGAAQLASTGDLPVNVRIACDGEEEIGGDSILEWLEADERGAAACVIFDSPMIERDVPAFVVAVRGLLYFHLAVRAGERDLHSGLYGGAAMNALHVLTEILSAVLPRRGRLPDPLRVGIEPPPEEELQSWRLLPPGGGDLSAQGARPADEDVGDEFYVRVWAEPSLDVNGVAGGEAVLQKTIVPAVAEANVSIRLAPGQRTGDVSAAFQQLVHAACPAGADLDVVEVARGEPGVVSPHEPAIELALGAFERALGTRPRLTRIGGSLPVVDALSRRGIPTVITGFAVPESRIHAPNERLPVEYVERSVGTARELFRAFAAL